MRFRHDWCSDPCRIMRQQQVLHAMLAKLKGDQINTLLHAGNLWHVSPGRADRLYGSRAAVDGVVFLRGCRIERSFNLPVPYTGDVDLPVYGDSLVPDVEAKRPAGANDARRAAAPEPSPDAMALAAIAPGTLRVDIVNGSGSAGAAHRVAAHAEARGLYDRHGRRRELVRLHQPPRSTSTRRSRLPERKFAPRCRRSTKPPVVGQTQPRPVRRRRQSPAT